MELLAIEKELAGPDRMAAMMRYDAQLVALEARLQTALAEGVRPEAFGRCEALKEAIVIARKLLRLQVRGAEKIG